MKKVRRLPIITLIALLLLLAICTMRFTGKTAQAYTDPAYRFDVAHYDIVYDIGSNCSISVTENITIDYKGVSSTGFIRDIPVNGGAQVRDVKVQKVENGKTEDVWYDVYIEESDFVSVDIGDSTFKRGQSESYIITYLYNISNSMVNDGMLPLNPVGHGWEDIELNDINIKLILPEGYISSECYVGHLYSTYQYTEYDDSQKTQDGRTIITAHFDGLYDEGVTFNLTFEDGAISSYTEITPYYFVIAAAVVLLILILLRLFVFNKNYLTPVVNFDAPDKMDPLIMGKLIDNKVNSEDITSLIYYWADKGFIKINLDDKDDPVLIRIRQTLPEGYPNYQHLIYNRLFSGGDCVKPSQLKNSFYRVVEEATNIVNKQTKGLYDSKSIGLSVLFAVLGGLVLSIAPVIISIMCISSKMFTLLPFIAIIPALIVYAFAESIMYNKFKIKKRTVILLYLALAGICLLFGLLYIAIVPSGIIGVLPKIILFIVCILISAVSVMLITRTPAYKEQLNNIIGFKNFIELAEKKQLEMMLESDPQFYYHILPYAQVLGVTDKWEHKFDDLTVQPPDWITGDFVTDYIEFRMINSMLRSSMNRISSGMISRPSSSGSNGGGRGIGGGFSGGGFGGGGGRGR
ncbi:MAG: DUF2207 domain-containing protein [Clostridia bacterium]|nr:DUF2207 domain-containing protein [Clostridia bacterium]